MIERSRYDDGEGAFVYHDVSAEADVALEQVISLPKHQAARSLDDRSRREIKTAPARDDAVDVERSGVGSAAPEVHLAVLHVDDAVVDQRQSSLSVIQHEAAEAEFVERAVVDDRALAAEFGKDQRFLRRRRHVPCLIVDDGSVLKREA